MHYTLLQFLVLLFVAFMLILLAQKVKISYPIFLVLAGLGISYIPGIPEMSIDPEVIFLIFLPPLLYEAAWYTSWKDFWRWRRVITSFAFLIVLLTSLVIALVSQMIIPGFTLALGLLLGGIVSPPDAVSATSILKTIKVPKRITAILEGESLLNDASSLIVFRFAIIAVSTGSFVFHEAALSFVIVVLMGVLIGIAVGLVYFAVHKWMPTDPNIDIILTLTAPYVMYIAAEHFHFSGVLAVVSGGLFLSSKSHLFLSHSSRLRGANVWSAFGFVLNGLVFMLIGLELPVIVNQLGNVSLGAAIGYGVLITLVLIVTRILSTLGASVFTVFISRYITTADNRPGWKGPVIIGWAGMRGVVSLAAALSIPAYIGNGVPFPQRNLILFITFTVILLTLVVQGISLPYVIKWVNMSDPDNHLPESEEDSRIRKMLAEHSMQYLDANHSERVKVSPGLQQIRARLENDLAFEHPQYDHQARDYQDVYLQLLIKQRLFLTALNKEQDTDEDVIRKLQGLIDLEEEKLRVRFDL